jgi:hypothetical protein
MEGEVQASANEQVAEHKSNVALRFQFNNGLIRGFTCGLEDEVNEVVIKFIGTLDFGFLFFYCYMFLVRRETCQRFNMYD